MIKLEIAGIIIELNMSIKLLHDSMYSFLYKGNKKTDVYWEIKYAEAGKIKQEPSIEIDNLRIYEKENIVVYKYMKDTSIPHLIVAKEEFTKCEFYISKRYENEKRFTRHTADLIKLCLFNSFREMFILMCAYKNRLAMHAAVVSYEDKAYLFSAPSKTGKSTHARLWEEEFGCEILNGDMAIVEVEKDKSLIIHGCPWCGTSGIYSNKILELGAIAFLKRNDSNRIYELDKEDVGIRILENHFVPFINKEVVDKVAKMINIISNKDIKEYLLECTKSKDAAILAKENMVVKGSEKYEI